MRLLFIPMIGSALLIGNPAQPSLQKTGIIQEDPSWWCLRVSYFGDYVYKESLSEEFSTDAPRTHLQMWTQAAMLTLNLKDRIDVYGIFGGTNLEIKNEVFTKPQMSWGVGGKVLFLHEGRFRAGCDIKYFQSKQRIAAFYSENLAYNLTSDFSFNYHEVQAALGLAYKTKRFSPYLNASYLIAKLEPSPVSADVRLPSEDIEVEVFPAKTAIDSRFGIALGLTLIDKAKGTLSLEWRAINQNSIDLSGEIRF